MSIADFVYCGRQYVDLEKSEFFNLYTCLDCGTTISEEHLLPHLKKSHHKRYYEVVKAQNEWIANRFNDYVCGVLYE